MRHNPGTYIKHTMFSISVILYCIVYNYAVLHHKALICVVLHFIFIRIILLYRSPNTVRVIKSRRHRWASHVDKMEESMSAFKILKGTSAEKIYLGTPRRRWEGS